MQKRNQRLVAVAAGGIVAAVAAAAAVGAVVTGASSSAAPYIVPTHSKVDTYSLLTVGDSVGGYRMAGIPDGLGAWDNGDGTFSVVMNHELGAAQGRVREHGFAGAFVSKWTVDKATLRVLHGEDLIEQVMQWTPLGYVPGTRPLGRLCSGDLPEASAFYDAASGTGYAGGIFLSGEEVGHEGRAFGHVLDGTSWELPHLGKMSWENAVAHPDTGEKTVVVDLDDSRPGQVYVYVGEKQAAGNPVERAGLTDGRFYGIKVQGHPVETIAGIPSGTRFELVEIENPHLKQGVDIDNESRARQVTDFARPEDGAWDPRSPSQFYWVTTGMPVNNTPVPARLWRFNFDDAANPAAGGTIDMLLDGTEGGQSLDNLTIDHWRRVLIQEDPGGNPRLAKVWSYSIPRGELTELAQHTPALFDPANPAGTFMTNDEESSGIIPLDEILGPGWYLLDSQVHQASDAETVEKGQLLAMYYPPGNR